MPKQAHSPIKTPCEWYPPISSPPPSTATGASTAPRALEGWQQPGGAIIGSNADGTNGNSDLDDNLNNGNPTGGIGRNAWTGDTGNSNTARTNAGGAADGAGVGTRVNAGATAGGGVGVGGDGENADTTGDGIRNWDGGDAGAAAAKGAADAEGAAGYSGQIGWANGPVDLGTVHQIERRFGS